MNKKKKILILLAGIFLSASICLPLIFKTKRVEKLPDRQERIGVVSDEKKENSYRSSIDPKALPVTKKLSSSEEASYSVIFKKMQDCNFAQTKIGALRNFIENCRDANGAPEYLESCSAKVSEYEKRILLLEPYVKNCPVDEIDVNRQYFDSVQRAAENGDLDAQLCYIKGSFGMAISDADKAQYRVDASQYVKEAFEKGDWRVVQLFEIDSNSLGHSGNELFTMLTNGSSVMVYRMNRLLRLGAVGDYARTLDLLATESGMRISREEEAQGDAWAKQEYDLHFRSSPRLYNAPEPCASQLQKLF